MSEHKHKWSEWSSYWYMRISNEFGGVSEVYFKRKEKGTRPVWLTECLVCHTVRHKRRDLPRKKRVSDIGKVNE